MECDPRGRREASERCDTERWRDSGESARHWREGTDGSVWRERLDSMLLLGPRVAEEVVLAISDEALQSDEEEEEDIGGGNGTVESAAVEVQSGVEHVASHDRSFMPVGDRVWDDEE